MAGIVSKDIYRLVETTTTEIDIMDRIYHGDVDAYNIDIEFHGVTSITGTCNLHFVLSDGTALDKDASDGVVIDGKNVKYTLPTYLYQKSGNLTMYVQFMNSNIYTPLKVNFKNIVAIPDGGKEVVATTTYPVWYDEVVTNEEERVANEEERVAAELIRVSNEEDRGIGSRTYTEQNYVTNGETITASLDAIDTTVASHMADYASKFPDNAGAHNSIFRGKNLGSTPDYTNITNGSFKDMYIGDYWTINGINWRIAAFNYYRNTGDTNTPSNHVVVVPDQSLYSHAMNDTDTTEGGYTGSKMYLEGLEQAKTIINNAFPGHVVTFRAYLSNAVSNGEASAGEWFDSTVDLMNEIMVYGSVVNGAATYGLYNIGTEKSQLPLFALNPQSINTRYTYWLRDVTSASRFAAVDYSGYAFRFSASYSRAVRPRFLIS